MVKIIKRFNEHFTNDWDEGETMESRMEGLVGFLYKEVYNQIGILGYEENKEKIVATQVVIDIALKKIWYTFGRVLGVRFFEVRSGVKSEKRQ